MLLGVGKKTPCVTRFSTTTGERGSADSLRDPRAMALKFKTGDGNWDWVWNNVPFFFIRDPAKFPSLVHSQKRHPATNLRDPNMFWNWVLANQESLHMIMWMFSEYGAFNSFRFMNSYQGHAHRWTMPDGSFKYVHMFLQSDQGHRFNTDQSILDLSGNSTDHATKDLYEAIERGDFPTWTAIVQVIDPDDVDKLGYNIFDMTKHWDMGTYPKDRGIVGGRTFGKLTLNRNPENYFAEVEQLAFSPSHLVPGIEPGPDPLLQARLFAYPDAQRHRLGVNYQQLPVNVPKHVYNPLFRDGASYSRTDHTNDAGNNVRSTYRINYDEKARQQVSGDFFEPNDNDIHYPRAFWQHLAQSPEKFPDWQSKLVSNVSNHLSSADPQLRNDVCSLFEKVDGDLASSIRELTEERALAKAEEVAREQQIGDAIREKRKVEMAENPDH